jgi:peptidoglycan hydrolase-like protein with peptidoglycan-binding domain
MMRNILLVMVCCLLLAFAVSVTVAQEGAAPAAEQPPAATEQPAAPAEQSPATAEQPATAPAAEQPAAAAEEKAPPAEPMAMDAEKIKAVQEALNKAGAQLKVDGKVGKMTRKALKKFQKRNDLPVTGKPDAGTLAKLGIQ